MSIKYVRLEVSVHGIDTDEDHILFLKGWIETSVEACLLGNQRAGFNYHSDFDSDDIEVKIIEEGGE